MDPRDHSRALTDGRACTVCNEPVPVDRIRLSQSGEELTLIHVNRLMDGSAVFA